MSKISQLTAILFVPAAALAEPTITDITLTQDASREVTITYKLAGEPAVVTLDVITNCIDGSGACPGASIGGRNLWAAKGDVNRLIGKRFDFSGGAKKDCTITWSPYGTEIGESGFKADPETVRAVVKAWPTNCPPDYMVVSLDVPATTYGGADAGARAEYYPAADFVPGGITENPVYKETKLVMRKIPAAGITWRMGTTAASDGTQRTATAADEIPHLVRLTYDYYMGVFPVTQGQFLCVTNENPSKWKNLEDSAWHPVESIACAKVRGADASPIPERPAADSIIGKMSVATGVSFDLPKEAEWEYACRAGSGSKHGRGANGADITDVATLAWYGESDHAKVPNKAVGLKQPNAWGLYDMYGLVWEFCLDYHLVGQNYYNTFGGKGYAEPVENPFVNVSTGSTPAGNHVDRGSSYAGGAAQIRAGYRSYYNYNTYATYLQGFRLRAPAIAE